MAQPDPTRQTPADPNRIQVGDIVNVYFSKRCKLGPAVVVGIPGDGLNCWRVREAGGPLSYFQQYEAITALGRPSCGSSPGEPR